MRKIDETLNTDGSSLWSHVEPRPVRITGLALFELVGSERPFGELCVTFDTATWSPDKHGLIYTDAGFLAELKEFLTRAQYDVSDLSYSECGMQGDTFVSLDVGPAFINSWNATK